MAARSVERDSSTRCTITANGRMDRQSNRVFNNLNMPLCPAYTIIEILAVIGIVALIASLTLAAVTSSREAARRSQCGNNLRQIGLGMHQYLSVCNVLPLAYGGPGNGISFLVAILPYVEQTPLYDTIDMRMPPPLTVSFASLSVYVCPSDGLVRTNPIGGTNYAGNQGSGVQDFGYNGAFALKKAIGYNDFTDGTAGTVAVSEWLRGHNTGALRDRQRSVFLTPIAYPSHGQLDLFAVACLGLDPASAALSPLTVGSPWIHGDFGHSLYNHVMSPGNHTCLNCSAHQSGAWTAKSNHEGRVHVAFADGHVSNISETIRTPDWRALGSRNGGELVQVGTY